MHKLVRFWLFESLLLLVLLFVFPFTLSQENVNVLVIAFYFPEEEIANEDSVIKHEASLLDERLITQDNFDFILLQK